MNKRYGITALLLLASLGLGLDLLISQSTNKGTARRDFSIYVKDLPPERANEEYNADFRDFLIAHGYPIGNVIGVDLSLNSGGLVKDGYVRLILRCLVLKAELDHYVPEVGWEKHYTLPLKPRLSGVEDGALVEIDKMYDLPTELFMNDAPLFIKLGDKKNVLLPRVAMRFFHKQIEIAKTTHGGFVIGIPIEL